MVGVQRSRKPAATRTPVLVARVAYRTSPRWLVAALSTKGSVVVSLGMGAVSTLRRPVGAAGVAHGVSLPPPQPDKNRKPVAIARFRERRVKVFRVCMKVKEWESYDDMSGPDVRERL